MTYTYDPASIGMNSISKARFELGDTMVEQGDELCMLCDEEIEAIIGSTQSWRKALFKLADGVCMKLSFETDWRDDGAAFSLNQRAERWKAIRDKLQQEATLDDSAPQSSAVMDSMKNPTDGGHYFRAGMMQSPFVQPPSPYRGDGP